MIPRVFKVSHNFAFLCSCFVIYARRLDISEISRIIVGCIFVFIVILVLILYVLSMVISKFCYPLVVDVVTRLSILHYMNKIIAVEDTTSSFLSSWLGRRLLIVINHWIHLRCSTVMMLIFIVIIEVARADWLEQLPRDWHVLSNQFRIGSIVKHKGRLLRFVLLLRPDISLSCT